MSKNKDKKKNKGHAQAVRKRVRRVARIEQKRKRRLARRELEWVENGWDARHPDLFKAKFHGEVKE